MSATFAVERSARISKAEVIESRERSWGKFMTRSPLFAVLAIFLLCVAIVVFAVSQQAEVPMIVSLLAVATLAMNIVDRHLKTADTMEQIKVNTKITKEIPDKVAVTAAQVASKLVLKEDVNVKEAIAENRSDAYSRGFQDGWRERGELGKPPAEPGK